MPKNKPSNAATVMDAADEADLLDRFAFKLSEMGRIWRSEHERKLKPLGLSLAQWHTLRCLKGEDGRVQKHLAFEVGIEEAAMVGVLDRLVAADLVERREAIHDRRAKTVHLTAAADDILERCEQVLRPMREALLCAEPTADLSTCIRVFDGVVARLMKVSGEAGTNALLRDRPSAKGDSGKEL